MEPVQASFAPQAPQAGSPGVQVVAARAPQMVAMPMGGMPTMGAPMGPMAMPMAPMAPMMQYGPAPMPVAPMGPVCGTAMAAAAVAAGNDAAVHAPTPPLRPLKFSGMRDGQPVFQHMQASQTVSDVRPTPAGGLVEITPHGYMQLPYVMLPVQPLQPQPAACASGPPPHAGQFSAAQYPRNGVMHVAAP